MYCAGEMNVFIGFTRLVIGTDVGFCEIVMNFKVP